MSWPTWAPTKFALTLPAQLKLASVPNTGLKTPAFTLPVAVELNLLVTSPPTTRVQTPPPGWLGWGSPGADTKALPCWLRNAVLILPKAPAKAPEAAPPAAAMAANCGPKLAGGPAPGPVTVPTHCAKAPELVEATIAKAMPAKIRLLPTVSVTFMS